MTPANIQENIDDLPADTPDAEKPKSLQAILSGLDEDAEDEGRSRVRSGRIRECGRASHNEGR